ncbi:uncharacterized protein BJX67DRAFT_308920 [Aspergillus lucknowensis]|uniref:Uncharacterized protein n=1 Tax=Aspergillus lucknowensis TaxID=176173 RepID=A0ABR4LCH7_9EURO
MSILSSISMFPTEFRFLVHQLSYLLLSRLVVVSFLAVTQIMIEQFQGRRPHHPRIRPRSILDCLYLDSTSLFTAGRVIAMVILGLQCSHIYIYLSFLGRTSYRDHGFPRQSGSYTV